MSTFNETTLYDEFEVRDSRHPEQTGVVLKRIAGNTADVLTFDGQPTGQVLEMTQDTIVHIFPERIA